MFFSGIVVTVPRERTEPLADQLAALPGVRVHVRHEPSGRLVLVLESLDPEGFEALFHQVRTWPGVLTADLVYHFDDRESAVAAAMASPISGPSAEDPIS